MIIRAIGIDAAFSNMGFAHVEIHVRPFGKADIYCKQLRLASTTKAADGKTVRVSSDRLRRAQELRTALTSECVLASAQFAFVEVPSGTQSAVAAFGLGISVGVLASCPVPIIEVSPMEVKAAVAGMKVKKGASKAEVIAWAEQRWPDAPWLRATSAGSSKGKKLAAGRLLNDNEHLADALATVAAGIETPEFKRLIALHNHATSSTPNQRSASGRRARLLLPVGAFSVAGR